MKNTNAFSVWLGVYRAGLIVGTAGLTLAVSVTAVRAQNYTLSVGNGSINVNLSTGLSDWTLGGVDELGGQSFFYSLGGTAYSIDEISSPSTPEFSGSGIGSLVTSTNMSVTYGNSALKVTTGYTLQDQGSSATLATSVNLQNVSGTSETLQFYQLSDFTIGGVSGGQTVQFQGVASPFAVTQTGGGALLYGYLSGVGSGTSISVEEVAGSGNFGLGNGTTAPSFDDSSLSATGSVDYAYEFNVTLAAGSGVSISELQTVPEPSSLALAFSGMLGLALLRGRGLAKFKKS